MKRSLATPLLVIAATIALACASFGQLCSAAEWPMLGRDGTRNSVSPESGAPVLWNVEERHRDGRLTQAPRSIRWVAPLGLRSFSSPVVSGGLVWIGAANVRPGATSLGNYESVLKCFRVTDGKQVYEFISPTLANRVHDPGWSGLGSSPLVEGDRLWIMTNRAEILCLDIGPLLRGAGEPRELWKLDLAQKFDVFLHMPVMGPPRPCSIGPTWNGRVYVTVANGVAEDHITIPKPNAPCLVCLNKDTGEVLWTDNSPGANIITTQIASPTIAEISGGVQVIVPQSDGWLRAFDPEKGTVLWEFDVNPKASVRELGGRGDRNDLFANAVVYDGHVYLASGRDAEQGEGPGRLVCIDPNQRGDVSSELAVHGDGKPLPHRRMRAFDPATGEKAVPNPNSALVWEFVNCGEEFEDEMHRTVSSVAVSKGLVIATDFSGLVHCLDAQTGKRHWTYDTLAAIWTTPLIVDDKVYVGDEDGEMMVFQLGADSEYSEPVATISHPSGIYGSPVYADGTLYVPNRDTLFAVDAASARTWSERQADWPQWRGAQRDNELTASGGRVPNAIFVPTPQDVVAKMLAEAKVGEDDVVYDLGSGDGRIVIEAAKRYRCRAVGIELDPALVALSRQHAQEAKVDHLVTIKEADLFSTDFSEATVVAVYLYPGLLNRLYPKLRELSPGARIISHQFEIPNYPPEATFAIDSQETGAKHTIYLWTSETPAREIRRIDTGTQGAIRLAVSRNGSLGASAGTDGTVRLWNLDTGKESKRLIEHAGQAYCVAISPDGRLVASGGEDKKLLLWDVETGNRIRIFTGHENNVCGVIFSADGKRLASGSWDKTIRVWDVGTGKETTKLLGHTAGIMGVAFSPDGKRLVSAGGEDLTLRLWDLASAETIHKLEGHSAMVRAVDFSPDGQYVLSGAYKGDGSARLWDAETGKQLLHFGNIAEGVHGVAYAAAGRRAIIAGADRAELWDLETGKIVQSFVGLTNATDAVFLPDGKHALLASYGDKTLRLWCLPK